MKATKETMSEFEKLYKELTPRQRKFVELIEDGKTGTAAALEVGYGGKKQNKDSAAVAASRLLKNDKIVAYRRVRTNLIFETLDLSKESLTIKMHDIYSKSVDTDGHLALKALGEIAKVLGLNEENKNVKVGGLEDYLKNRSQSGGGGVNY